jgi:hypothetical protein
VLKRPAAAAAAETVEFPEEFRAWLEYLEIADPNAYQLFQQNAEIDIS